MQSPGVIDIEGLLAPIAGASPAGADPRGSRRGSFAMLKQARAAARAAERKLSVSEDEAGAVRPNWRPVLDLASRLLRDEAKDLEAAAYLVEALVRLHGFAGLRDGLRLCRGLVEGYWDELHPLPDQEGVSVRVAALMGLNGYEADGTLIAPILTTPITGGTEPGPFSYAHYEQARRTESLADAAAKKKRIDRGAATMKAILEAVAQTPTEFYARLAGELDDARAEFDALGHLLDELCGEQAPHTSNIRNALEACRDAVHAVARDKLAAAAAMAGRGAGWLSASSTDGAALPDTLAGVEGGWEEGNGYHGPDPRFGPASGIPSREHALILLQEIAEFFRRTEPHSPIPYTLEQAIRWGRTPLPQLLEELIPDPGGREHYFRLVGIPPQPRAR